MKKSTVLILGLLGLFMVGCFPSDDGYFYHRMDIYDAFTFENQEKYQVGDTIFFNLSFSRYLDEDGYDNKLDIYETTISKKFFYTAPFFQKFSAFSESYERVYVREELLYSPNGTIKVAKLNTSTNIYESQMGIVLVEGGSYSISFNAVNFHSDIPYFSENINLDITNFSKNNPETYYFIVEE